MGLGRNSYSMYDSSSTTSSYPSPPTRRRNQGAILFGTPASKLVSGTRAAWNAGQVTIFREWIGEKGPAKSVSCDLGPLLARLDLDGYAGVTNLHGEDVQDLLLEKVKRKLRAEKDNGIVRKKKKRRQEEKKEQEVMDSDSYKLHHGKARRTQAEEHHHHHYYHTRSKRSPSVDSAADTASGKSEAAERESDANKKKSSSGGGGGGKGSKGKDKKALLDHAIACMEKLKEASLDMRKTVEGLPGDVSWLDTMTDDIASKVDYLDDSLEDYLEEEEY